MVDRTGRNALIEAQRRILLVKCAPPPRGCGAEVGVPCTSTSRNPMQTGKPLGRQIAHWCRKVDAGLVAPNGGDVTRRCRQTALPADECEHCERWAELTTTRPPQLSPAVVAVYAGHCVHCDRPWPAGVPIVRVTGGWAHLACSVPAEDEPTG